MPKLPNKIIPISNADKSFHEKWYDKRNMLNIPHPFRACCLGPPNVGKSTVIKNLIIRQHPPFEEIFVIHCDAEHTQEYKDLGDEVHMLSSIPAPEHWEGKVKTLCIIAEKGIDNFYDFENDLENVENFEANIDNELNFANNNISKINKNPSNQNIQNYFNNSDMLNSNPKGVSRDSIKKIGNFFNNRINCRYEYNKHEKVYLLFEKMELSKGFNNIQQKTSKTNSYKFSFILNKELSNKIKAEIENNLNEIKKQNNNNLEKRDDYENIQRQKKLKLSIKNNFKNIFEHNNYITDRYGAKLSDLFKNYCCFGDPLNTTWMKSNKFSKLLKDANLLILNNNTNHNTNFPKQYKETKGIPVNDIDVFFIKLSSSNNSHNQNSNSSTNFFGSLQLRDLSMNTYISNGTNTNKNTLNLTRSSYSSSLSPNKIKDFQKRNNISNTNSAKIDFIGFINAIEIISLNIYPEKNEFDAMDLIVTKHLFPLLNNFDYKSKYSEKYSILYHEKSNNFEYVR